jgi:hypothetical protein
MRAIGKVARRMDQVYFYLFRIVYFCEWRYLLRLILEWKQTRVGDIYLDRPELLQRLMAGG